jgi:trans-L-3-hydroxyproline dehydratase
MLPACAAGICSFPAASGYKNPHFVEQTSRNLRPSHEWALPAHGLKVDTVDAHACGQPLRLVLSGFPEPSGATMIDKCGHLLEHCDHLRRALLLEPRGHPDMYACILTAPQRLESHFGALFLHHSGISPMSGHGIICAATLCVECGVVEARAPETLLKFDTPAGLVRAYATMEHDRVRKVFLENVPSWAAELDCPVRVDGIGVVRVDIAYGGEFFAFVDAGRMGLELSPENSSAISQAGVAVAAAVQKDCAVQHPTEPMLGLLSGVIFHGPASRRRDRRMHSRQVCVFTDGSLDRSPSGTGMSGRLAILHRRGSVAEGEAVQMEGLLGGVMSARIARTAVPFGPHDCVIVEIEGTARLTGRHSFFIDPQDELGEGFLL